jgi:hypothetical protein
MWIKIKLSLWGRSLLVEGLESSSRRNFTPGSSRTSINAILYGVGASGSLKALTCTTVRHSASFPRGCDRKTYSAI